MNRPRKNYPITQDGYPIVSEDLVTYLNEIDKYCDILENALEKACEILDEGYGEEYASYEYFPTFDTMIRIPKFYSADAWEEWLLKDE